jgi:secondary thiamine-phosphate synthase enzyme
MRIYSEYITVHSDLKREFMNITPNVKSAVEKSGMHDGLVLVAALHSNSAVFLNDHEAGLLEDIGEWLDHLAPARSDYRYGKQGARTESNAAVHLQSLVLNQQAVLSFTDGKLEMGPWQNVIYAELDGMRPKRIHIKVLGE